MTTNTRPPVGLSLWESELYEHLTEHMESERALVDRYEDLANRTGGHVAYLLRLIMEDEARHHRLFDEWRNALRFTDEFIWSALPKTSANDVARLRALLPPLEKALRHGLTTVAYHEADMRQLLADLAHFYERVLAGQKLETKTVDEVVRVVELLDPDRPAHQWGVRLHLDADQCATRRKANPSCRCLRRLSANFPL